ncbi:hypothetical protein MN608_10830 [Microdochium nivale]|nr:hypothetical protein MN608_10830 [Microdochium nivale]
MPTYALIVQIDNAELDYLSKAGFQLVLARKTLDASTGTTTAKTIFRSDSSKLRSCTTIRWQTSFALNWHFQIPAHAPGQPLQTTGSWHPCAPDQAYELVAPGIWLADPQGQKAGALAVRNSFSPVSLVLGVQDPETGAYSPIYVGWKLTPPNAVEEIRPKEEIELWLESEKDDGLITTRRQTRVASFDMTSTKAQGYRHWFRWNFEEGGGGGSGWAEQDQPFPQSGRDAPAPLTKHISFTSYLGGEQVLKGWAAAFEAQMARHGWNASTYRASAAAAATGGGEGGASSGQYECRVVARPCVVFRAPSKDLEWAISESLRRNRIDGDLPADEEWSIADVGGGILDGGARMGKLAASVYSLPRLLGRYFPTR